MPRDATSWVRWAEDNKEEFAERWGLTVEHTVALIAGLGSAFEVFTRPLLEPAVATPQVRVALDVLARAAGNLRKLKPASLEAILPALSILPDDVESARRVLFELRAEVRSLQTRLAQDRDPDRIAKVRKKEAMRFLAGEWERVTGRPADARNGPTSAHSFYKTVIQLERSFEGDSEPHRQFSKAVIEEYRTAVRRTIESRKSTDFRGRIGSS